MQAICIGVRTWNIGPEYSTCAHRNTYQVSSHQVCLHNQNSNGVALSTHHCEDLVVGEACLAAQLELPELLDPPDDAHAPALLVQHVLLGALLLACGDPILVARSRRQPVVAGRERNSEPIHDAVLVLHALGEVGMRRSWNKERVNW